MLRKGIPISQRGSVWKAIVDHKLMRVQNDKFESDYYKKLLGNYNPTCNLTPAAKQVIAITVKFLIEDALLFKTRLYLRRASIKEFTVCLHMRII